MMNRQTLFTIAGVVFALMIALCGWILTNALLDNKETALLAVTGSVYILSSPENLSGKESIEDTISTSGTEISKELLAKILNKLDNLESSMHPHEPSEGQISMEQAIAAAEAGLSYFRKHGIIPPELFEDHFTQTNAFLWENAPYEKVKKTGPSVKSALVLAPEYSFWTITFDNNKLFAQLILNAVTGKIWKADISSYLSGKAFDDLDVSKMIDIYSTYLGLDGVCSFRSSETWASKGFAENMIHVAAAKRNTTTKKITEEADKKYYNGISLFLYGSSDPAEELTNSVKVENNKKKLK